MDLTPFNLRPSLSAPSSSRTSRRLWAAALPLSVAAALMAVAPAQAADASGKPAAARKAAARPVKAHAGKKAHTRAAAAAAVAAPLVVQAADQEQIAALERVNVGTSQCEFRQHVSVSRSTEHPGYLDLNFKGRHWLMKPVVSSTGAIRLEDVRAETLFIQIRDKSMLMNQKTGQRLVDGCVHPSQAQAMSMR